VATTIAAVAVFWLAALSLIAVVRYEGDFRAMLCLGDLVRHPAALDGVKRNSPHGYDGQYYAALATDPLLLHEATITFLDAPAYRATRVLVSGLAWVVALGHAATATHLYLWLNWVFSIASVGVIAAWLHGDGRPLWWSGALALSAGLVISMVRATPDAAALALLLAALLLQHRGRTAWAIAALALAVLARETSLLAVPPMAWAELQRRRPGAAIAFAAAPLTAFLAWQSRFWFLFGIRAEGTGNFSAPFSWLPAKLARFAADGRNVNWMELWGVLAIAAAMGCLVVLVLRPRDLGAVEWTFVAFAVLGLFLNEKIYGEAYSYARVLIALPFLAAVMPARPGAGARRLILGAVIVLFALSGVVALRGELRSHHFREARERRSVLPAPSASMPILPDPEAESPPVPIAGEAAAPPLYLLPAAHIRGHDNARWRTELVIENASSSPARITVELLLAGRDNARPLAKEIALDADGRLVSDDALGELFGADGAGALRILSHASEVRARLRTYDASRKAPRGPFLEGRPAGAALGPGRPAVLANLASDPDERTRRRSNVGLLNLRAERAEVELILQGADGAARGVTTLVLRPLEFRQLNDVFPALGVLGTAVGQLTVATATPGAAILAYATVVRREPASVSYVLP
jgi:hypothetical protein